MNDQDPTPLEARMTRLLRQLPDRRAPAGLEARVLAEISRRAALPWWRASFVYWPLAARMAFLAISVAAAGAIVGLIFLAAHTTDANVLAGSLSAGRTWLELGRDLALAARDRAATLVGSVPTLWLYGVGLSLAVSYAALAALGTVSYRAFSLSRPQS
jgi:hypothetical protein